MVKTSLVCHEVVGKYFYNRGLITGLIGGLALGGILTAALYTNLFAKTNNDCQKSQSRPEYSVKKFGTICDYVNK